MAGYINVRCLVLCSVLIHHGGSAVSQTDVTVNKLRSIVQWLDKMSDATVFDYIYRVNRGAGLNLFQGDIKGYSPRNSQHRTAIRNHQQLWNTRVVPYLIDTSFDSAARKDILGAIEEYHTKTCIRFVPRTSEPDYIHFKQISGCYSNVGRTGGEQEISLMGACLKKGTAIHEMMHALGFWHEQSRPDRDSWVQVIRSNVQAGKEYNFDKLSVDEVDTLGVQYDYGSVMHYSKYAFSKNGNPTILPTRGTNEALGQRIGLSGDDVKRINTLYRCDVQLQTTQIATQPPQTLPPQTKTSQTQLAWTQPPQTQPPKTQPPQTQPPKTQPPQTQPPKTQPPQTQPPKTQPPQTQPLQTQLPKTQPPQTQPPQTQPPKTQPPQTQSLQTQPPKTQPPQTQPPQTRPPQTQRQQITTPAVFTYPPVGWTSWSLWSPCDLQCRHSRYRFCLNFDNSFCPGDSSEFSACPYPCQPAVPLGCWKVDPGNLLVPSVEGLTTELSDPYKQRSNAIRKCADYAASQGFKVFSIFDDGQCLTGPNAHVDFSKGGPSTDCRYRGKGSSTSSSVFSFQTDIDGGWSLWTGWGQCTTTCGLGRRYRYRRCDNPPPLGNGTKCSGSDREFGMCEIQECTVHYKCGMRFHAGGPGTSGLIWVRDYDNFMECDYHIRTGDPASSISVLINSLDIEYSRGCIYDSLMVFDGSSAYAPMVGAFCGQSSPKTFQSTSNSLYLKFETDETNTGKGFTVFYNINSRSRKACARPPRAAHVSIYSTGNMVGDRVYYQCHGGFRLVGHSPITCLDQPGFAVWDDVYPRCVPARRKRDTNSPPEVCTFGESLCGFVSSHKTDLNWRIVSENEHGDVFFTSVTPNTTQRQNLYLRAESSRQQMPGDVAQVQTGVISPDAESHCLKFRYRIDGSSLAIFRLYVIVGHTSELVWETEGLGLDKIAAWRDGNVDLRVASMFQVEFLAVLGDEIGSSVSLDDVVFTPGSC